MMRWVLLLLLLWAPLEAQVIVDLETKAYVENTAQAKHIVARIREYVTLMGLDGWRIYVQMRDVNTVDSGITASTSAQPQYRTAHISFYLRAFSKLAPMHQEEAYRHELFHLLLWPVGRPLSSRFKPGSEAYGFMMMLREGVVTNLARMKVWETHEPRR